MSDQKTVLVGVTGGIAAYKSCYVVRGLQKAGVRVKVAMTEHAAQFVGPATFRALTNEQVAIGLFDDPSDPIHHISLTQEADVFVIAPATANFLAKMACGIADDLLSTTALAATGTVMVSPAMNMHMYLNPATQQNMQTLKSRGIKFIEPGNGYQACGDVGPGRMAEPDQIVSAVLEELNASTSKSSVEHAKDFAGKKIVMTAGPTVEAIDPVRYVTNWSSGKTGYAIAKAAVKRGADVVLVSGPVGLDAPAGVRLVPVKSARDMLAAVSAEFDTCDLAIFAAAVADMRPAEPAPKKLKKAESLLELSRIEMVENPDILKTMGHAKTHQKVIGFAAETNDVITNAKRKLASKGADMIVANQVGNGITFGKDTSKTWFVSNEGVQENSQMSKSDLADVVLDRALQIMS